MKAPAPVRGGAFTTLEYLEFLELSVAWRAWEGNDISDIAHPGDELDNTFQP